MIFVILEDSKVVSLKKNKQIYILIGPKGSGKSFIGQIFEKHFQIHFVRVEDWAIEARKSRAPDDESYARDFFKLAEKRIRDSMNHYDEIVFESTGLTSSFDIMYHHLEASFKVILIKIVSDPQLCLNRVRSRDQHNHIDVSENLVHKINQEVARKNIPCEFSIQNSGTAAEELRLEISSIIHKSRKK